MGGGGAREIAMKIFVTGSGGFLGHYVCKELMDEFGLLYDLKLITPRSKDLDLRKHFTFYDKPDVVVHLAANVGGIGKNDRMPGTLAYDNLMMGLNVIEACRLANVPKVVVVGTICAYPKFCDVPFREEDIWNGYPEETNAPYGVAKKALLVLGQAYRLQFNMNIIHPLIVNLYGPRDNFDLEDSHVIPAMIRKFHEAKAGNRSVTLWGDGSATREFLFVRDAAKAIVKLVNSYDSGGPINVGSGNEVSILELARTIKNIVGFNGDIHWDKSKPNGQPRRCLDVSKINALGWSATTSLEDGLRETYNWWRNSSYVPK